METFRIFLAFQHYNLIYKLKKILLALLLIFSTLIVSAQPSTLYTTFNPNDIGFGNGDGANSIVLTTGLQSDEKIIIGGSF